MPSTKFSAPIDIEEGPDGHFYVLEYGSGWFTKNPEAAISRIDYYDGDISKLPAPAEAATNVPSTVDSAAFGHQQGDTNVLAGKRLVETLDCKACHKVDEKSIGPGYKEVAAKYSKEKKADVEHLVNKIINGGSGVWGEVSMPAHPSLSQKDAKQLTDYILSLK